MLRVDDGGCDSDRDRNQQLGLWYTLQSSCFGKWSDPGILLVVQTLEYRLNNGG